jgi:hypothetical protein
MYPLNHMYPCYGYFLRLQNAERKGTTQLETGRWSDALAKAAYMQHFDARQAELISNAAKKTTAKTEQNAARAAAKKAAKAAVKDIKKRAAPPEPTLPGKVQLSVTNKQARTSVQKAPRTLAPPTTTVNGGPMSPPVAKYRRLTHVHSSQSVRGQRRLWAGLANFVSINVSGVASVSSGMTQTGKTWTS